MAHIHEKIDFVSTAFIVHKDKVLLGHHRILNLWLPIGGHIELDEDPITALYPQIKFLALEAIKQLVGKA